MRSSSGGSPYGEDLELVKCRRERSECCKQIYALPRSHLAGIERTNVLQRNKHVLLT